MSSTVIFNLDEKLADVEKNYKLTFNDLKNLSINIEDELKKYLFRGWFLSTICEEEPLESCPCCGQKISN